MPRGNMDKQFDCSRQEHVLRGAGIRAFRVAAPEETEIED